MFYWDMLYGALLQQSRNIVNDFALTISLSEQVLARPIGRIKVSLKFGCPEKKLRVYDAQMHKNAIPTSKYCPHLFLEGKTHTTWGYIKLTWHLDLKA